MPLYNLYCDCGHTEDRIGGIYDPNPACPDCGTILKRAVGSNIMVKMKGEGGYPARRKQIFNTTYRIHPELK